MIIALWRTCLEPCANMTRSLHAEDLAHILGMQQKDLRKLCARLREDRMIAVYAYKLPVL